MSLPGVATRTRLWPSPPKTRTDATVVIPCYNYGRYLDGAVHAALDQKHVDMRVIIVDDRSSDGSLLIARQLAEQDERVTVIAHERNQGHIQTFNDGLDAVETEFVALVSADDLVAPGAFDRAVGLMQRAPDVGLTYGKTVTFDDVPPKPRPAVGYWRTFGGAEWVHGIVTAGWNPIRSPEAILRTSVLREVGPYSSHLRHTSDLEYWIRAAAVSDVAQLRGIAQAFYRIHGSNMHLTEHGKRVDDIRGKLAAFETLRRGSYGVGRDTGEQLYRTGVTTLVREALGEANALAATHPEDARTLAGVAEHAATNPLQAREARDLLDTLDGPHDGQLSAAEAR